MAENKTVIIAMVNKAHMERRNSSSSPEKSFPAMMDLFLESFREGEGTGELLDHLLVVAADEEAYGRCRSRGLLCHRLVTDGVDFAGEKIYMSEDFIKMMWRRTLFLYEVLKRGYHFIFTDVDVMWLRNPLERMSWKDGEDLQISTDAFNGDPWSELNPINTAFYHVRSNNKTVSLFKFWYMTRHRSSANTALKEQDVLTGMVQEGLLRRLGVKIRFVDTDRFGGFCQDSGDAAVVTTVHANCCRSISAKVVDLAAVLSDWRRFRDGEVRGDFRWSRHVACMNSWNAVSIKLL